MQIPAHTKSKVRKIVGKIVSKKYCKVFDFVRAWQCLYPTYLGDSFMAVGLLLVVLVLALALVLWTLL